MKKELLEKIKRIVVKASNTIFKHISSLHFSNISFFKLAVELYAPSQTHIFTLSVPQLYCPIPINFSLALSNDDYVSIRDIEYTEYKIIDMLTDNCILDGNSYWIDYEDGMLHVIDSEEGEWYEIDLTDCKLVKSIEGTVEKEMELHIKYDDLLFKIKEVEGEAICDVLEIDDNDFDKDQYIRELEEKVNKQSVLIKLLRDN